MEEQELKILSLSGILGYGYNEEAFKKALEQDIDVIGVDGGSSDPGPYYLGSGKSFTERQAVKRDLSLALPEAIKRNIPFIIGTAGGAGGEPHLQWMIEIFKEVAKENNLSFKMAEIHCEVEKGYLKKKLEEGKIKPFVNNSNLTINDIEECQRVVGQIGVDPFIFALEEGVQVILAGRACDTAIFASSPIMKGYDPGLAYHMAKIIECGAMCTVPLSAADVMLAEINKDHFFLESPNPIRKCTVERVAAHTLYEQVNPYYIYEPDGIVDLRNTKFEQYTKTSVRVSGSKFIPAEKKTIKIEGVKLAGYRTISICGARDIGMIKNITKILNEVQKRVKENIQNSINLEDYTILFRKYGIDAVEGLIEPLKDLPHEIGIIVDVVGKTQEIANIVCAIARSNLLHIDYPGRKTTAGNIAFPYSPSDISLGSVYNFNIYHLVEVENLSETSRIEFIEVGSK